MDATRYKELVSDLPVGKRLPTAVNVHLEVLRSVGSELACGIAATAAGQTYRTRRFLVRL